MLSPGHTLAKKEKKNQIVETSGRTMRFHTPDAYEHIAVSCTSIDWIWWWLAESVLTAVKIVKKYPISNSIGDLFKKRRIYSEQYN